jgi:aryl-alcohol dehydrogenase-like predicted oxidoreductase
MRDAIPSTTLGSTGLAVSRVGLGLAALGRPAYIDLGRSIDLGKDRSAGVLERRCHEVLDAAFSRGVRYVDVARSYGKAEAFLASWLGSRSAPRSAITVGSKWGYAYVGDWDMDADVHERKDHSVEAFRRQIAESRAVLDGWLDLYQIHSATVDTGVLDDRALLARLVALRSEGMAVGLTVSGPGQADAVWRALDVDVDGMNPFQTVQATWNIYERRVEESLQTARNLGWGVIVKEVLANGRLTDRGDDPNLEIVRRVANRHGASVDAVALAVALSRPWADVVLSGAVTPAQLATNLDAFDVHLSDDELEELATLREPSERYWQARAELSWT